jgi:tetratricopeptide (TPR) repeat protein
MPLDLYAPCPCGSGKKFKWCCQPIHVQIDKAFRQDSEGQHEAALRLMDELTAEHASNPEAWGRKAQLLYQNARLEDAEAALQKAFDINPNYPFGHLLRGIFRQHEGEIAGALLLFRKAADLYDPEARDTLASVYSLIAESELQLNRPVAAHAALKAAQRLRPNADTDKMMQELFGDKSRLPGPARTDYTFQSPAASAAPAQRAAWDKALSGAATGRFPDAAAAFEPLVAENPNDTAAWYNLGLTRAWLGDNQRALEALDRYVGLEADESRAALAWALAEALRFGQGMEDQADYVEHSILYQIRDPQKLIDLLHVLQNERRLTAVQVSEEQGLISGVLLDQGGLVTAGAAGTSYPKLGAYLLVMGGELLRLWSTNTEALDRANQHLLQRAGPALSEPRSLRGPANFGNVFSDAMVFPTGVSDAAQAKKLIEDHIQRFFEETWLHRPLRSLNNVPPVDAAGSPLSRKKLLGVVEFLQACGKIAALTYDFDRLRRKLGIASGGDATIPARPAAEQASVDAMAASELAALEVGSLTDEQVDRAYRAAMKLDAQELATRFAKSLVSRPASAGGTDRYPVYNYLVQRALAEGDPATALGYVDEGERADCEHNEGKHRNDYELRRGQVLVKQGDVASARDVFERLMERVPTELRYRGTATEAMLSAKQGETALRFAEGGLAKAREKNDRDSEQYFLELAAAARKVGK